MDRNEKKRLTDLRKEATKRLAEARREWKFWRYPDKYPAPGRYLPTGYPLYINDCPDNWCGHCEACTSVKLRKDKLAEVEASGQLMTEIIALVDADLPKETAR